MYTDLDLVYASCHRFSRTVELVMTATRRLRREWTWAETQRRKRGRVEGMCCCLHWHR